MPTSGLAALILFLVLLFPAENAATPVAHEGLETVFVDRYALPEISEDAPKLACHEWEPLRTQAWTHCKLCVVLSRMSDGTVDPAKPFLVILLNCSLE